MPVTLRNNSGHDLRVGGHGLVEDEALITVKGDLSDDSPDDGYLIGDRVYPTAHWKLEEKA